MRPKQLKLTLKINNKKLKHQIFGAFLFSKSNLDAIIVVY